MMIRDRASAPLAPSNRGRDWRWSLPHYLLLQVFHPVEHFFAGYAADEPRQSSDLLANGAPLVGLDDDAAVVDAFLEMLAMQTSKVAHVARLNGSPLPASKRELVSITCPAPICLDRGQDIDAPCTRSLDDGVLACIFVHSRDVLRSCPVAPRCALAAQFIVPRIGGRQLGFDLVTIGVIVGQCSIHLAQREVRVRLGDVFGTLPLSVKRGNPMDRNARFRQCGSAHRKPPGFWPTCRPESST